MSILGKLEKEIVTIHKPKPYWLKGLIIGFYFGLIIFILAFSFPIFSTIGGIAYIFYLPVMLVYDFFLVLVGRGSGDLWDLLSRSVLLSPIFYSALGALLSVPITQVLNLKNS